MCVTWVSRHPPLIRGCLGGRSETCSMKGKSGNDPEDLRGSCSSELLCEAAKDKLGPGNNQQSRLEHSHGKASFAMFQPRPQDPALAPSLPFIEKFVSLLDFEESLCCFPRYSKFSSFQTHSKTVFPRHLVTGAKVKI